MKTIRNKTRRPIRVPLPGRKVLHLGPSKDGQIADNAVQHAGLQKLVQAGEIEVLGEGERAEGSAEGNPAIPEATHGRGKPPLGHRQGNR